VIIIGEQHPGVKVPNGHGASFARRVRKKAAAIVVQKDRFAPGATRHHMVNRTGIFDSIAAGHHGDARGAPAYCE
jgi:hypothetical protein